MNTKSLQNEKFHLDNNAKMVPGFLKLGNWELCKLYP